MISSLPWAYALIFSCSHAQELSPLKDDFHTGRRARLANLANKFKQLDDEEEEVFKEEVLYCSLESKFAVIFNSNKLVDI